MKNGPAQSIRSELNRREFVTITATSGVALATGATWAQEKREGGHRFLIRKKLD